MGPRFQSKKNETKIHLIYFDLSQNKIEANLQKKIKLKIPIWEGGLIKYGENII